MKKKQNKCEKKTQYIEKKNKEIERVTGKFIDKFMQFFFFVYVLI